MRVGDDVFVYRQGDLPSWFRWQGLPCTIISIENRGLEMTCRMPDGNNVSFYRWELTVTWPPVSDPIATPKAPANPIQGANSVVIVAEGPNSLDGTEGGHGCRTCQFAAENNWFGLPPRTTHCKKCHATWSGYNVQHCVTCHRTFGSEAAANAHKVRGRCVDPSARKTNKGKPYYGEPQVNEYRTEIWRGAPRENSPWQERT